MLYLDGLLDRYIAASRPLDPTRSALLEKFRLFPRIVRAEGHHLFGADGRRYLDFLSQFGAVSLGHNHPELLEAIRKYLEERRPAMVQPLGTAAAEDLSEKLVRIAPRGMNKCVFANSGAEAVEVSIKLARANTGRSIILSTKNGFHGKTLGALSATGRRMLQRPFGAPAPGFQKIPFDDIDALETRLRRQGDKIAAFLVEPIQAEAGVIIPDPDYLSSAAALCKRHGVLLIVDEIQTGLGRTGRFLALPPALAPDMLLLSKTLGGGLVPISVCLVRDSAWSHEFGHLHSSTFANNGLACAIGLMVIEILLRDRGGLVAKVGENGLVMKQRLGQLREAYPEVIREVRVAGHLAGVEFQPHCLPRSSAFSMCEYAGYQVPLFAGYLLNEHSLLTAPVFNNSSTLRLEPPFTVGEEEIGVAMSGLERLCDTCRRGSAQGLFSYLIGALPVAAQETRGVVRPPKIQRRRPSKRLRRFAFLVHPNGPDDYIRGDPSFGSFTASEINRWMGWTAGLPPGVVHHVDSVKSSAGCEAEGWLIAVPFPPAQMYRLGRSKMLAVVRDAVEIARRLGAEIVGLGGFNSILSDAGSLVRGRGVPVTSGNSLSALAAVHALEHMTGQCRLPLGEQKVAIVGATGSVGRLVATLLSESVAGLLLIGNPFNVSWREKCESLAESVGSARLARLGRVRKPGLLNRFDSGLSVLESGERALTIEWSASLQTIKSAHSVLVATNSPNEIVTGEHLRPNALVGDLAIPSNLSSNLRRERPDLRIFQSGLVGLPNPTDLGPLQRRGTNVLGCLGETILLAWLGGGRDWSIGQQIDVDEAKALERAAGDHGIRLTAVEEV